ncbi:unnamed protein product [Blepharisma stoltei]|uniref:Uncharacterized protein n=1 Tax=Blepharisma stoltei TaxID=1481888 RepID=A0AAU9JS38_9CILI|nr:unnamed protein product [Blepharisma stoltei]
MDQISEWLHMISEDPRDDTLKITILESLIDRYSCYKYINRSRRTSHFGIKPLQDPSNLSFHYPNFATSTDFNSEFDSFTLGHTFSTASSEVSLTASIAFPENKKWYSNTKIYSAEEFEIIRHNFIVLFFEHKPKGGARVHKNELYIHIANIIQFFLDCCITTSFFLNQIIMPEKQVQWMDLKSFGQAMERVQYTVFDKTSFFYKPPDQELKKMINLQKLLFFYCVVEFGYGNSLGRNDLKIVMNMALKSKKKNHEDTTKFVEWTFKKKQEIFKKNEDFITFEEFHKILKN